MWSPSSPEDTRLASALHAVADIDGVGPSADVVGAPLQGLSVLNGLQGVNHHAILHIGVVADVQGLALIAAQRGEGPDVDPLSKLNVADDRRLGVEVGRARDLGLVDVIVEVGEHVFAWGGLVAPALDRL